MDPGTEQAATLLTELKRRRAELRGSMSALEHALASPSAVGTADWAALVRDALEGLSSDLGDHIEITEGPDGLYRELEQHAPRLIGRVDQFTREHSEITGQLEQLLTAVKATDEALDVDRVRRIGTELVAALMRHRQRGADLVFEAYQSDIGGET